MGTIKTGTDGNDTLDGNGVKDTLIGLKGNDIYIVDLLRSKNNVVLEDIIAEKASEGTDTVQLRTSGDLGLVAAATVSLAVNLENLDARNTGSNKLNLYGNTVNNVIHGNDADNLINGGLGADTMIGGLGNDTYVFDNVGDTATESSGQGTDTIEIYYTNATATAVTIDMSQAAYNNIENLTVKGAGLFNVTGNGLDNVLIGNAAVNTLSGGAGNDTLDGGLGADILRGGLGNDIFIVDNIGDQVIENASEGTDTVKSYIHYTLGANVENLTLLGAGHLNATGNATANTLTGNTGNNILDGGLGADTMSGGFGNDTYIVDNAGDVVVELLNQGIDTVKSGISYVLGSNVENLTLTGATAINGTGNELNNVIIGNEGNNTLDGGAGTDTLRGGKGNDIYIVDLYNYRGAARLQDGVYENANEGTDTLRLRATGDLGLLAATNIILGANLENLDASNTGTNKLNLTGNAFNNTVTGNAADNIINGGLGADTMIGGNGNDTYIFDNIGDVATETLNQGTDTIEILYANANKVTPILIDMSQAAYNNIENLTVKGAGLFNVTGNGLNNVLIGNGYANTLNGGAGNDTLNGGLGADTMVGGTGDDIYVVDNIGDVVTENDTEGTDTVQSGISYVLGSHVENLVLTGVASINGTGNALVNELTGNAGHNILDGGDNADIMTGGKGNDTYIVDNSFDDVVELVNEGIDTVKASVDIVALADNVENLTLLSGATFGTGNVLNNIITGNEDDNILDGAGGKDTLIGGKGNDSYEVDLLRNGNTVYLEDVVSEKLNEGVDTLTLRTSGDLGLVAAASVVLGANLENLDAQATGSNKLNLIGNALDNEIYGNDADNMIDGGLGADIMAGGLGDDTYVFDNVSDLASELVGEGSDTIQIKYGNTNKLVATEIDMGDANYDNVENMTILGAGLFNITGNGLDNVLIGNGSVNILNGDAGNDTLNGGLGADTMIGGTGDDIYVVDNIGDQVIENASEGADTVQSSVTYSLADKPNIENITLTGVAAINAIGNAAANTLIGNAGNNTLDGGAGADRMEGGKGNDTYIIDSASDVLVELANEGVDTVRSGITHALGANIENLTLTGATAINGTGNELNNTIIGNDANNALDGGAGVDVLRGGKGDDTYSVDLIVSRNNAVLQDGVYENANEGTDTLRLRATGDLGLLAATNIILGANLENLNAVDTGSNKLNLTGNAFNNNIFGNAADNIINGGLGADTMVGGNGNDTYIFDNVSDVATETLNQGTDTIEILYANANKVTPILIDMSVASYNNIENLTVKGAGLFNITGNGLNNVLIGNGYANTLSGGAGNDTLNGGLGADIMVGGTGDDIYVVDNIGDVVTELAGQGTDTVQSAITYSLSDKPNIENITLTGVAAINATGNAAANTLIGNAGHNMLDGDAGADRMEGGVGNDTYVVDNAGDVVVELLNQGIDTVKSGVDYTLTANVENLILTGTAWVGTGNALNNTLTGNDEDNLLDGAGGKDTLIGGKGNDTYEVDLLRSGNNVVFEDIVVEKTNEGTDSILLRTAGDLGLTVFASVVLGANLETLDAQATGSNKLNLYGNALVNYIFGNDADNLIDGGLGADMMAGGLGNDTYIFDNAGDMALEGFMDDGNDTIEIRYANTSALTPILIDMTTIDYDNIENITLKNIGLFNIKGSDLDNVLIGNAYANTLEGGVGNDTLNGGLGADTMIGGVGDDVYVVDNAGDVVTELANEGNDTVLSGITYSIADKPNLENITLSGVAAINATGNAKDNILTGNDGHNILDGGAGADIMMGRKGNDTYYVDNIAEGMVDTDFDDVIEFANEGIDTVIASKGYSLTDHVENLILTGTDDILGYGNNLNNIITGNEGDNLLDGAGGVDTLIGGKGDDTYMMDLVPYRSTYILQDAMIEKANEGIDTVIVRVPMADLGNVTPIQVALGANLENLDAHNTFANKINLTGNTLNNTITGNDGINVINGGAGNDILIGGQGADTLVGGIGLDEFLYQTKDDSKSVAMDHITDFSAGDKVTFEGASGLTYGTFANGGANLEDTIGLIQADAANDKVFFFAVGTNGYLYVKGGGTGENFDGTLICLDKHAAPLTTDDINFGQPPSGSSVGLVAHSVDPVADHVSNPPALDDYHLLVGDVLSDDTLTALLEANFGSHDITTPIAPVSGPVGHEAAPAPEHGFSADVLSIHDILSNDHNV